MAMHLGSNKGIVADMNVTPMIDVLLVLIIIFMMIQPATITTGLDASLPHPPTTKSDSPRTVVIQVLAPGSGRPHLLINQQPVEPEALRARIIEIYKTRAERVMFVKADPNIDFAEVASVIDTARGAFQDIKVGLITTT